MLHLGPLQAHSPLLLSPSQALSLAQPLKTSLCSFWWLSQSCAGWPSALGAEDAMRALLDAVTPLLGTGEEQVLVGEGRVASNPLLC